MVRTRVVHSQEGPQPLPSMSRDSKYALAACSPTCMQLASAVHGPAPAGLLRSARARARRRPRDGPRSDAAQRSARRWRSRDKRTRKQLLTPHRRGSSDRARHSAIGRPGTAAQAASIYLELYRVETEPPPSETGAVSGPGSHGHVAAAAA